MTESDDNPQRFWSRSNPLRALDADERDATLLHLRERAEGQRVAHQLATELQAREKRSHYGDPEAARRHLDLVRALRQAGRITFAEYVLQIGSRMELVSDHRSHEGAYSADLAPISEAMDQIARSYGLAENEYWKRGDEPDEYRALADAYDACLDAKLVETMREFGEADLASLRETDPAQYDALREEGRRSVFEKDNHLVALTTLIDSYEREAEAAGGAGAYLAGCLLWGAAVEGLLLLWCLRAPEVAQAARQTLPARERPKRPDPADWTLDSLVHVSRAAGWLGVLEDDDFVFLVDALLQNLRQSRNLIHPGRSLRQQPHLKRDKAAFDDAKAAYTALRINEAALGLG
ncbi:hypothetical protein [Brevundimonas sp. SORGH_AS_0993]|uniref:hypothetical protein n=1 Tax=Brevundimonas sp. SORGH_AS_0993 TaxID=3041794 RepID=UPI00278AEFBB|nr:hypothetical protein [Brevundimonas sp. SORGH_AS_0993]MDQ1153048.1 hypothetical protein [Brevundimonas sp. SORGH_AS_0993]